MDNRPRITVDREHGMAYVSFVADRPRGIVARSVEVGDATTGAYVLDFDAAGHLVGVEVFEAWRLRQAWEASKP